MGAGYEHVDEAMHDQYAWGMLAVLAGLKMLATVLSFASGTPGGLFAPTLFIGAMLGGAVCGIARIVAPDVTGPIGAYALVGMGTLFAGILRAPMTSVFMMVEVSGNYSIVLPVMVSNSIAYMISRRFQPTPIFEVLSHQDGVVLPSMEEQRETRPPRVEDAMRETTLVLAGDMTVSGARTVIEGAPDGVVPGAAGRRHLGKRVGARARDARRERTRPRAAPAGARRGCAPGRRPPRSAARHGAAPAPQSPAAARRAPGGPHAHRGCHHAGGHTRGVRGGA